jgi:predicted protein tyrosine phosphatase
MRNRDALPTPGIRRAVMRVLFLCSRNRLRSPTAEQMFSGYPGLECASAGLSKDADNPLTAEDVEWADLIFVMEKAHRTKLSRAFRRHLANKRVICLDIPDEHDFMDPELIRLLEARVTRFLPPGDPRD